MPVQTVVVNGAERDATIGQRDRSGPVRRRPSAADCPWRRHSHADGVARTNLPSLTRQLQNLVPQVVKPTEVTGAACVREDRGAGSAQPDSTCRDSASVVGHAAVQLCRAGDDRLIGSRVDDGWLVARRAVHDARARVGERSPAIGMNCQS